MNFLLGMSHSNHSSDSFCFPPPPQLVSRDLNILCGTCVSALLAHQHFPKQYFLLTEITSGRRLNSAAGVFGSAICGADQVTPAFPVLQGRKVIWEKVPIPVGPFCFLCCWVCPWQRTKGASAAVSPPVDTFEDNTVDFEAFFYFLTKQ